MKSPSSLYLSCLSFAVALCIPSFSIAQNEEPLRVVKSTTNAESENPELCLEFNRSVASIPSWRFTSALRLEANGKTVTPPNVVATDSSLCLFPLEHGTSYRLLLKGLKTSDSEKRAESYALSFTIPNRAPGLVFTNETGGVNEFGSYGKPLTLRAINVAHASVSVHHIADTALMARIWQDRALTALAPSETAYLARDKGTTLWREEETFDPTLNATTEQKISLREKMPDLKPGLFLIVADAGKNEKDQTGKGPIPLAAAWFINSDFSIRAVRNNDDIRVFAQTASKAKANVRLAAFNGNFEQVAEAKTGADGIGAIPYPSKIEDKNSVVTVVASDDAGNVAFADIENLPTLSGDSDLGVLRVDSLFVAPFDSVDVLLFPTSPKREPVLSASSNLRLSQGNLVYASFPVAATSADFAKLSFPAPAMPGDWSLLWEKTDGTVLAETTLHVTANPDAPRLEATSEHKVLGNDGACTLTIKARSSSNKPVPLAGGHVLVSWQKLDPAFFGWKDYNFGTQIPLPEIGVPAADFLTDLEGRASLRLNLPGHPKEHGLYQAAIKVVASPDSGIADAPTLVLPLKPEETAIGVKPLAAGARFPQNGLARFALIGISSDGKPRDVSGLSYQVFEEGRSFDWYQDGGRWKYKPEAQLRPVGGGALSIKADESSLLEWPVAAGNYRLEIADSNGKVLARTTFSAGWDSASASASPVLPLNVQLPKVLQIGHEAQARISLPEDSMLTVLISDTRLRKVVHEFRPKGNSVISFTPMTDWAKVMSIDIQAVPQSAEKKDGPRYRTMIDVSLTRSEPAFSKSPVANTGLVSADDPSALLLRKGESTVLSFGIKNNTANKETYNYSFTTSSGLKIDGFSEGVIAINGKQSNALELPLIGAAAGAKELRLEVKGQHTPRLVQNWPMSVLPETPFMKSAETVSVTPNKPLVSDPAKARKEKIVFVSRRPMNGLAELLTYVFNAEPFTTAELALTIDVLRLWRDTINQAGIAPDFITTAREKKLLAQMLRHQNVDGGFAAWRGGESTMEDTASALTALGAVTLKQAEPAKNLAIGWIKQRLSNTWFDEKERAERAAGYAALAAADAIDPASLHYFSDTSAALVLPPVAEAQIAAAFKHIADPDAAAFWIKKMLDENGKVKTISLLNALTATDALSSDDVLAATSTMAEALRGKAKPELKDAAALLRTAAINNAFAGKGKITNGKESRDIAGVLALRLADAAAYRNDDTQPLHATFVAEDNSAQAPRRGLSLSRRIFRLNGIEAPASTKPVRNEIYIVELKGEFSDEIENASILLQSDAPGLRPAGCPLSPKLETLSFIPWLAPHTLTPVRACEFSPHEINVVLTPENKASFTTVFLARIDTPTIADLPMPEVRLLKQE